MYSPLPWPHFLLSHCAIVLLSFVSIIWRMLFSLNLFKWQGNSDFHLAKCMIDFQWLSSLLQVAASVTAALLILETLPPFCFQLTTCSWIPSYFGQFLLMSLHLHVGVSQHSPGISMFFNLHLLPLIISCSCKVHISNLNLQLWTLPLKYRQANPTAYLAFPPECL